MFLLVFISAKIKENPSEALPIGVIVVRLSQQIPENMLSRKIKTLAMAALMCCNVMAQSGEGSLFSKTMSRLETDGPSQISGTATINYGDNTDVQDFELSVSANKFKLVLEEGETTAWFDSKTLWNGADYGDGIEEIYISNPTPEEVVLLNPAELMKHSDSFKITQKGKDTFIMEPKKKGETVLGVSKVTIRVDVQTSRPVQIDLEQDDSTVSARISSWKPNQKFADSLFTCPTGKYPSAEIIDLR